MRSHIFPELLWQTVYDANHVAMTSQQGMKFARKLRKGLREPLLCSECEALIGRYEHYFAGVWLNPPVLPTQVSPDANAVHLSGLDYIKFKLFHLSIIWRCGVAQMPEFGNVKLGPHEPRLREMLLSGSAGTSIEYPLSAAVVIQPQTRKVMKDFLVTPQTAREQSGAKSYVGVYAGCLWRVGVSNHPSARPTPLKEDGSISMALVPVDFLPHIVRLVRQHVIYEDLKKRVN